MLKRLNLVLVLLLLMVHIIPSTTQNVPARTRTIKQIVPVDKATEPYFAIQILALKETPRDASFFSNIKSAREFSCADGYKRYVVGRYTTKAEAVADLSRVRSKGQRYAKSYVVNTGNFAISSSFKSEYSDEINKEENTKKDNLSSLRTRKKIVPVDKATAPPFAIQIVALKNPPQDPKFFKNVEAAREFTCTDGYARYVVGQYETAADASSDLSRVRSLSPKYKSSYVVNTFNFSVSKSAFSSEFIDGGDENVNIRSLRTSKRIKPVDKLNPAFYTVQVLALKETPKDAEFFKQLDVVLEASCTDGYKRYLVGQFLNPKDARAKAKAIRNLGPNYKSAFIVSNQRIQLDATAYSAEYNDALNVPANDSQTEVVVEKNIVETPIERVVNTQYPNDVNEGVDKKSNENQRVSAANNEVLESGGAIEFVEERRPVNSIDREQTLKDEISITTESKKITEINKDEVVVELPKKTTVENNNRVRETPNLIRTQSGDIAIKTEEKVLVNSRKTLGADNQTKIKSSIDNTQLPKNRTDKKIIPVDKVSKPFYTIQVLALKDTPTDPEFFDNIESAREFSCKDGYKRYVVGKYESYEEAKADISRVKNLSPKYKNAFVANTKNYKISLKDFRRDFVHSAEVKHDEDFEDIKHTSLNETEMKSNTVTSYEPNKTYTIQLTASRYPFYVSELKEFNEVYEFYMPDKVFRYTVGKYSGTQIEAEIKKVAAFGYEEAFAVEWTKYLPYKIE